MQFWKVHLKGTNISWFGVAHGREDAKNKAFQWIEIGDKDDYEVTPLTEQGDRFKVEVFYV